MGRQQKRVESVQRSEQTLADGYLARMHPSLRANFVPLPPAGTKLSPAELEAIFGGDLRALRDLAGLSYQSDGIEAK